MVRAMADHANEHVPVWTLGDRLRKARREAALGTSAMAARLRCHRNTVLGWETDKVIPPLQMVVRWSRVTHVPLPWLLEDFDPPNDPASECYPGLRAA
jgi:transcriptional regulator with XRE-family HTH domain